MPQGQRSDEEQADFDHMLQHVNLLFLGMFALVVCDMTYATRFWTQFEFWTMMQTASSSGVVGVAADAVQSRYSIRCVGNAPPTFEGILLSMWQGKTIKEAHDILMSNDVLVTNQKDKDVQLKKLEQMNEACIKVWGQMDTWLIEAERAAQQLCSSLVGSHVHEFDAYCDALSKALTEAVAADIPEYALTQYQAVLDAARDVLAASCSEPIEIDVELLRSRVELAHETFEKSNLPTRLLQHAMTKADEASEAQQRLQKVDEQSCPAPLEVDAEALHVALEHARVAGVPEPQLQQAEEKLRDARRLQAARRLERACSNPLLEIDLDELREALSEVETTGGEEHVISKAEELLHQSILARGLLEQVHVLMDPGVLEIDAAALQKVVEEAVSVGVPNSKLAEPRERLTAALAARDLMQRLEELGVTDAASRCRVKIEELLRLPNEVESKEKEIAQLQVRLKSLTEDRDRLVLENRKGSRACVVS